MTGLFRKANIMFPKRQVHSVFPFGGSHRYLMQDGEIIGIVSVGFLVDDVRAQIFKDLSKEMIVSLVAIMISIIGSYMLARSIRKDTLGLEPFEIANLYKEKNAVLQSVKEGILAIDQNGVDYIDESAGKKIAGY